MHDGSYHPPNHPRLPSTETLLRLSASGCCGTTIDAERPASITTKRSPARQVGCALLRWSAWPVVHFQGNRTRDSTHLVPWCFLGRWSEEHISGFTPSTREYADNRQFVLANQQATSRRFRRAASKEVHNESRAIIHLSDYSCDNLSRSRPNGRSPGKDRLDLSSGVLQGP